jgi:tRNA G18 (ribose-2'-O)-methylase SpoU
MDSRARANPRRQLAGPAELDAALDAGAPVRLVLAAREPKDPATLRAVERARTAGVPVRAASEASLRRLSKVDPPAELLALVGPAPDADPATALASGGLAWLLVGLAYPGNTGFAIRLAEVWTRPFCTRGGARRCAPRCAPTISCPCSGTPRSA